MIASNDIKTILYKAVKANAQLGAFPEIAKDKHKAVTEQTVKERIVVIVNATDNSDWQGTYGRICVYVPKQKINGEYFPNTSRLTELEKICIDLFYKRKGNKASSYCKECTSIQTLTRQQNFKKNNV